tara:strand:+ start:610 stop:777 length:168 start_codon:yes stop_codon:yes gene_type:complete
MKSHLFQRWGRASSFGFSSVGFVCRQKPNVLDRALAFYTDAQQVNKAQQCALSKL